MIRSPSEYLKRKRNYLRQILIEMKGSRCKKCGYCKSPLALEFHHRNPQTKRFKLSGINLTKYTWIEILRELEKTDLLCSNCHAEIKQT